MKPLPTGEDKPREVRRMFDAIAPRYDLVNRVMTFGLDIRWRKRAVAELGLPPRARVLDIACGTGDFCRELLKRNHEPIGLDFSLEMLHSARVDQRRVPLVQADALALPFPSASMDGITCGFALRNVLTLRTLFDECARVLRPSGRAVMLEVAEPKRSWLRKGHSLYFNRIVPMIGGALSDRDAYEYLPRSVEYLPPPDELVSMMNDAGFTSVRRIALSGGITQLLVASRLADAA